VPAAPGPLTCASVSRPFVIIAAVVIVAAGVIAVVQRDSDPRPSREAGIAASTSPRATSSTSGVTPRESAADIVARAESADVPGDVVDVVRASEGAIRDPRTPAADLPMWARAQQIVYRELARHPEWDGEVSAALGGELAVIASGHAGAFRELWALTDPRDELPEWEIVAPPPAEELLGYYRAAEAEFGVGWEYLAAIHLVETRMGRIRGLSTAGARGPMQFIPSTWEAYGEGDIDDPNDAIAAAARYLIAAGAPTDMQRALFAYNHSDHYVAAVQTYAAFMRADERAYLGYYHWEVYYRLKTGDVVLPVGWTKADGSP